MYDYNSVEYEIWYDNKNRNLFFSVLYILDSRLKNQYISY